MSGEENKSSEIKDVLEKISILEDLHNVLQLDIINLKNEIDRLKLIANSPIDEETGKRIIELEKLAKDVELFKRWKQTVEEVKFLRDRLMSIGSQEPISKITETKVEKNLNTLEEIEKLKLEIEKIRKELRRRKKIIPSIDIENLKAAIEENRNAVENLKIMLTEKPKEAVPDIDYIRQMTNENKRLLDDLRMKVEIFEGHIPTDIQKNIENLHEELMKLEETVKNLKQQLEIKVKPTGEIESLKRELYLKLEDLNKKFGPKTAEEIKRAIEVNKMSIEKLKSLIAGEEMTIENLKKEIEENRKFMQEVKNMIVSKGFKGKITIPPDPEMRKKMLQLEQRIEFLGKKLEKLSEAKGLKLPELPIGGKASYKEVEILKQELDKIVSRLNDFVTKEDVEKGLLERHLKSDEKLMTGEIYKELEEIKKLVNRNEDHITSVASDLENIKKEVGLIEKTEWGKKSEVPEIEELKKRIEELEKRIGEVHEGPVFIE
ncbi:MAG: hypothetical protein QW051_00730 [Candidatus Aenigmatarchaeota archaeon]